MIGDEGQGGGASLKGRAFRTGNFDPAVNGRGDGIHLHDGNSLPSGIIDQAVDQLFTLIFQSGTKGQKTFDPALQPHLPPSWLGRS